MKKSLLLIFMLNLIIIVSLFAQNEVTNRDDISLNIEKEASVNNNQDANLVAAIDGKPAERIFADSLQADINHETTTVEDSGTSIWYWVGGGVIVAAVVFFVSQGSSDDATSTIGTPAFPDTP